MTASMETTTTTVRDLKAALAAVEPARGKKSTIRVLGCYLFEAGRVCATDMVAHLSAPAPGAPIDPVLVHADALKKALGALKPTDDVTIVLEDGAPVLESRLGRTKLPAGDLEDWPSFLPVLDGIGVRVVDGAAFAEILRDCSAFVKIDPSRPVLESTHLYLDEASSRMVVEGCDSYRLARDGSMDVHPGRPAGLAALAPIARYLAKMKRVDEVRSTVSERPKDDLFGVEEDGRTSRVDWIQLRDETSGVILTVRQTAGKYPSAERLTPAHWEDRIVLPAETGDVARYIDRAVAERNAPLQIMADADTLTISCEVQDGPSHVVELDLAAPVSSQVSGWRFGFTPEFLSSGIAFVGEDPHLDLISPLRPGLLGSSSAPARSYLLMPVRLPE